MSESLNLSVEELGESVVNQSETVYQPSDKEKEVVAGVINQFTEAQDERDRTFEYLDNRTLIEYIEDSVHRFVTNVDRREDIEDWQAQVHDQFTRNKLMAILGKIMDSLPVAEPFGRGDEDLLKSEIVTTLFEYAEDQDDSEEFFIYAVLEAILKGTMVGYEGVETYTRNVRDVLKFKEGDDIIVKDSKVIHRKLISKIVPLEDFYPSSVGIRNVQDMPYCFWRKEIPHSQFLKDYRNYKRAKLVQPFAPMTNEHISKPFYQDYISTNTHVGNVEIIKYYNQDTDEFVMIANGIWLNPLEGEVVSPIPFNHKKLPFFSFKYDIFGSDFFYGKSLPDRLSSMQDVLNVLNNMLLDQSFLSIFPPILTAGQDDIEDDFLRPGRRIPVDTGGLPLQDVYMKLDVGTPNGWHQFILDYTRKVLEESSMDAVQQGVAGVGGRTTATEIRSAAAGVVAMLGLFAKFIKHGVKQRARLRVANILQFYTDPDFPIVEGVMGSGGSEHMNKCFNIFQVDSLPMTPGKRGTKIIEMYRSKEDMPTQKKMMVDAKISELESGKKVSKIGITPEYIRDYAFDIRLVPNPHSDASKEVNRALEVQFQQTMLTLYGPMGILDVNQMAADLIAQYGKDPSKYLKEEVMNPVPPEAGGGSDSMMPGAGGDNSANTVKGATGVGGEGLAIRDLMQ